MEATCELFHTGDVFWPSSGEPPREGPMVRIRLPPAESQQTFGSSCDATAMAKPDSLHSRTESSNPVPSSGESTNFRFLSRQRRCSTRCHRVHPDTDFCILDRGRASDREMATEEREG